MSVIAGIICTNNDAVDKVDSRRLLVEMEGYPADYIGTWSGDNVFLSCHAQWITPESIREKLPIRDDVQQITITADAIIDNREELFHELQIHPSERLTVTDADLILRAYLKWGTEAAQYLIGDFTFVIWDERKQTAYAARDMLGNRTLYYRFDRSKLSFSTFIRPLLAQSAGQNEFNTSWLAEYLTIPIVLDVTDAHATPYKGIHQLPPGHQLTARNGQIETRQYGSLTAPAEELRLGSNEEYVEAFKELFQQVVSSKLRTCKRIGSTLSGGLDSGTVVSFAARQLTGDERLRTYSYIPPDDFSDWTESNSVADESPYIQAIVEHVGKLNQRFMDFDRRSPLTELDEILMILETPYKVFENTFWIKGIYEQASLDGCGVLLTGARGNYTISWGSAIDYFLVLIKRMRWLHFYRELNALSHQAGVRKFKILSKMRQYAVSLNESASSSYKPDMPLMINPEFASQSKVFDKLKQAQVGLTGSKFDILEERQNYFGNLAALHMQGSIGSKLASHYGMVERDPTCDPRIVRYCLSLPLNQYVQNGAGRSLVRRATESYLPDQVRLNFRTRGVQGADWIHRMIPSWSVFHEELAKVCKDSMAADLMNVKEIKASMDRLGNAPRPEYAFDSNARFLMRSLIFYKFIKRPLM
ncbi:asparagine synthase-related protein [Paenibacillus tarimensis]